MIHQLEWPSYLYHLVLALGAWRANRDIITGHANYALDTLLMSKDGDVVEDQVADLYATTPAIGHVGCDPISIDSEGGKHGWAMGGRDLKAMGEGEVDGAGDFEGGDG